MAATLSAGVSSLILKLDTPYDRVRLTDIRDDLVKVQVWCSTTSGFTPSNSNKVFDGLSLSVVISKITTDGTTFSSLVAGTTYYVKYAFISAIDDVSTTAFTVSSELSATPVAASAQSIDISGYSAFVKNSAGTLFTPTSVALTAVLNGIASPGYTWTITNGTLLDGISTTATGTASISVKPATISTTSVTVTLSVTGTGISTPLTKTIVMAVVNDGQNATAYGLVVSAAAIQKSKLGVLNPASITVYGYFAVGTTTPALYAGRFKIYENGSATASYTSASDQSSYTYTPSSSNITSLKAELYLAGGTTNKIDEQFIPVVFDGTDTVIGVLSNETATVPANSAGVVASFAGAETTMSVFIGATDDSANWTFSAAKTNITSTASGTPANRTQTVTAISAISGYIDITASKAGYTSITKRFNVNKSLDGVVGTSSLVYDIVTNTPVIVKDAPDAATTGTYSSTTIQGKKYDGNVTSNYGWITVTANGDSEATTATDTASAAITLTPASTSGKSSYTARMYNQATVSGATLLDTQFINVVYKGAPGTSVTSVTNYYLASASASGVTTATAGWTTTVQATTATLKYLWNYEAIGYSSGSPTNSAPAIIGTFSVDGVGISSVVEYFAVSTSNTVAPTVWVTTPPVTTTTNKYLWNYETVTYTNSTTTSTAKRVIGTHGDTGNSAINPVLSNGGHIFPADKDGNVTSYTNSGTQLRVYEGANELSYDGVGTSNGTWTFSTGTPNNIVVGSISDSGTFATIGVHSGVLSGADSSAITYTITGKSSTGVAFTTTQTQTFSKSKAGQNSTTPGITGASNHRAYRSFAAGTSFASVPDPTTNGAAPTTRGGSSEVWSLSPVSVTDNNAQYQTDGVTAAGSTTTTWSTPYLSYFKAGTLEAIQTNTGNLIVTGTIKVGSTASANGDGILITPNNITVYSGGVIRVKLGLL
jgi:hypothetical protein